MIQRANQAALNHFQTKNDISDNIKQKEVKTSNDTEDKSKNNQVEDSETEEVNKITKNQTNDNEEKLGMVLCFEILTSRSCDLVLMFCIQSPLIILLPSPYPCR